MFEFIKSLEEQNVIPNCQSRGICTVDPTLGALSVVLHNELKQIAFYVVRAKEYGYENINLMNKAISAIAIELVNTNICENQYSEVFQYLVDLKKEARKSYLHFCRNNPASCEMISFPVEVCTKCSIIKMIKEGERLLQIKDRHIDSEKTRLLELIVLVSKVTAKNIERIKGFEPDFNDFDFEVLRLYSLTCFPATRVEKLKRRLLEFSHVAFNAHAKLNEVLKKYYGERIAVGISTNAHAGKSILVSGSDLKELEEVLNAIGDRDINVYTHNSLIVAHSYPEFQKHKKLIGHWGTENTQSDFANFKGVVFITKNSSQKIDTLYRGLIYSSEAINPKGVVKVENKNYEPLIQSALNHAGFDEDEPEEFTELEYNIKKIDSALENKSATVIFVGNSKNVDFSSLIDDKAIVNLEYPIEIDLLFYIVKKIKEDGVQSVVFFTQCGPAIINMLMSLIEYGFKEIYLSRCPLAAVSPHVVESLELDFGIKVIK